MQAADLTEFAKVINGIAAIKKTALTPEALELWWGCMGDWSIEDFKAAAIQVLKTTQYMPCPKDFEDLRKAGRDTPGEAWNMARSYIRWGLHAYTLDAACPPHLAKAIRMIGGPNVIGMCDEDKLHFLERRFCEHYETMVDSEDIRQGVPQIAQDWLMLGRRSGTFKSLGPAHDDT